MNLDVPCKKKKCLSPQISGRASCVFQHLKKCFLLRTVWRDTATRQELSLSESISEQRQWKRSKKLKPYLRSSPYILFQFRFRFAFFYPAADAMHIDHFIPKRLWYKSYVYISNSCKFLAFYVFLVEFQATCAKFSMISFFPRFG